MISAKFKAIGEYAASGAYEEPDRSLFYRKALGIRRFFENCELCEYDGRYLYPCGARPQGMSITPNYMTGLNANFKTLSQKNQELSDVFAKDFYKYRSSVPSDHTVAGNMWTHSMPHYERILKEGFLSYIPRIKKIKDTDIRDGLLHIIEGIKAYINRCISYLESKNADRALVSALRKVPLHPAENIYEAIVSWNFILYLDDCDNLGCLALGLYPYFNGEDVTKILKNLYDNLDSNDGYSMALGTDYNPLTLQCLEAAKGKRRPMIELFINESTPECVWEKALEVVKSGGGQPAFYNENVLLGGLAKKFPTIKNEDLKKFCGGGCTEAMIAGYSNVGSLDAGINLLLILEDVMQQKLTTASDFEEFYSLYIDAVKAVVCNVTEEISKSQIMRAKYNPLPMRTLLIDDCIDKGTDYNNGGARYKWSIINFAGMINVIDSMLVIRDFVFYDKKISAENLLLKLKENNAEFLEEAKRHKVCVGTDNTDANEFSKRISTDIFSMLDSKKPAIGEGFIPASIQFMYQAVAGEKIGSTPDGRESGAPLCDSLAAILKKDINGPTSLLNSVTSLDLKRALGVPVLNFNINPEYNNTVLKSLILSYMSSGGIQMQLTCISAKTLMDAYENPEKHKNIIVRVGGYSEYFYRLSDELKKMIIKRTIQK